MKIGQTAVIVFVSKAFGSALGFVATIYFARVLGAGILGEYFLILAVVGWLAIFGNLGLTSAITKRISEDEQPFAYFTAGGILMVGFIVILSALVLLLRPYLNQYIGRPATGFVVVLLISNLVYFYVRAALEGQQLVHVAGLLLPVQVGVRSALQVALAFMGFTLAGLVGGYAVAAVLAALVGVYYLTVRFTSPSFEHIRSLIDFAKYSWLGALRGKAFSNLDILVLGAFVSSSVVGVYAITWNIASFLSIFDSAIRQAMFPQMSEVSVKEDTQDIANLVSDSLAFSGLIIIPALVGGILLGNRLLRIYGSEFVDGSVVLGILIAAVLLYGYQQQCLNALKGVDRPDITFYINLIFLLLNIVFNVALITLYGMMGAAIATLASSFIGFLLAYRQIATRVEFSVPLGEITRQCLAALGMAIAVYTSEWLLESTPLGRNNVAILVSLICFGAATYFSLLFIVSSTFRHVIVRNLPPVITDRLSGDP